MRNNQPALRGISTVGPISLVKQSRTRFSEIGITSQWNGMFSQKHSNLYALHTDANWIDMGALEQLAYAR